MFVIGAVIILHRRVFIFYAAAVGAVIHSISGNTVQLQFYAAADGFHPDIRGAASGNSLDGAACGFDVEKVKRLVDLNAAAGGFRSQAVAALINFDGSADCLQDGLCTITDVKIEVKIPKQ